MTEPPAPPPRIAALRQDDHGRYVPWFVWWTADGKPDFRVVAPGKIVQAVRERRCFICGEPRGKFLSVPLGPMCTITRTTPEPPSHKDCAIYAAQVCPFLTRPGMRRREAGLPEGAEDQPGCPIKRNPGVVAIWTCRDYAPFGDGKGGALFRVGEPTEVLWFAEGRAAIWTEVVESMASGLPLLEAMSADLPADQRLEELAELGKAYRDAMKYLPRPPALTITPEDIAENQPHPIVLLNDWPGDEVLDQLGLRKRS